MVMGPRCVNGGFLIGWVVWGINVAARFAEVCRMAFIWAKVAHKFKSWLIKSKLGQ